MTEIIDRLVETLSAGQAAALATVIEPDTLVGRKLVVWADRPSLGDLGADWLNDTLTLQGRQLLAASQPASVRSFPVTDEQARELSLGRATEIRVFLECMQGPPTMLIVGAGHLAQPLSHMAKMLGFVVAVLDDRASFANRQRFPDADQIIVGYYAEELARFPITGSTYIVLMSRGHVQDERALRAVICSDAAYIGMIGSRRRVGAILRRLLEEGVPPQLVERVCSPIGVEIGAESPEEIAISILAEIITVRRKGSRHVSSLSATRPSRL